MSKFTRRQLEEQIGFSKEETDFIMEFQRKLPVLFDYFEDEDTDGQFIVNARDLWEQLGEPQGIFANWVKRKFESYGFVENIDYISVFNSENADKSSERKNENAQPLNKSKYDGYSSQRLSALGIRIDYMITMDMAKSLAMVDKKEAGMIARRYFIIMEKAIKKIKSWRLTREPLKRGYIAMDKALDEYLLRNYNRTGDKYDYAMEADALNIIATGFKATDIRNIVGCRDDVTRDSLTEVYNNYLMKLQEQDTIFLGMDFSRYKRYKMLLDSFNIMFPYPTVFKNFNGEQIKKRKEKFLDEIKSKYGE